MAVLMRLVRFRDRKGRGKLRLFNKKPVPVNAHGMPIGYQKMLVIDEFGGFGELPQAHENTFGYAVSVVNRPDDFGRLTDCNRNEHVQEVKASADARKMSITESIAALGPLTYGFYLQKSDPPYGWVGSSAQEKALGTLNIALGTVLRDCKGNVYVVVDNHNAYDSKLALMIRDHSDDERMVDGDRYHSDWGQFHDVLQTHDYVASALRGYAEIGDATRAEMLGMRIRRIGADDSIRRGL